MPRARFVLVLVLAVFAAAPVSAASFSTILAHRFTLEVQGDDAVRALHLRPGGPAPGDGLSPDVDRWYVGPATGSADAFAALLDRDAAAEVSPSGTPIDPEAQLQFAIHPLVHPAGPGLEVVLDLPQAGTARLEAFDVQGRRIAAREIVASSPGSFRVGLGGVVRLAPGAYWLKLTHGAGGQVTRKVMIAR